MLSSEARSLRFGRFTASECYKLFVGGKGTTRDAYIREVAEAAVLQWEKAVTSWQMEHGQRNEWEAIQAFKQVSGMNVIESGQEFIPYGDNAGATPDAYVVNFDDVRLATVDTKCPVSSFFKQKLMLIQDAKPEYQNSTAQMYWQSQMQMLAANVDTHYLVRYLTSSEEDEFGNIKEFPLSLEQRIFWRKITANKEDQARLIEAVNIAASERDLYIEIFKKDITKAA